MAVTINDLMEKGYFKIRIELGGAFDTEDPEEAGYAEVWSDKFIEVRELNATEAAELNEDPHALMGRLDAFIVEHNFVQDDEGKKKASKDQVGEAIKRSSTVYNHVVSEWLQHLPLVKRSAANSAK